MIRLAGWIGRMEDWGWRRGDPVDVTVRLAWLLGEQPGGPHALRNRVVLLYGVADWACGP